MRTLHWLLVIAFFTAYFTEDDLLTAHAWAGYTVGGIVVLRVVWGFVGPLHARFSDFLYGPARTIRYFVDLVSLRTGKRYLGHSPAGGVMVFALLIALAVTVWSGLEVLAREEGAGPLAGAPSMPAVVATAAANGDERDEEDEDEADERDGEGAAGAGWLEEVHEVAADVSLMLVVLHVGGVLLASGVHHENLVRAMITGRKRPE